MEWFYDGQIRRYVGQLIRMLSGYKYQDGTGKQTVVPVLYGDMSRQVASILNGNSENKIPSAPRIAVYISNVQLDRSRLADATHISKVHIREREKVYDNQGTFLGYSQNQGAGYTVERLMPTPYKLTVKADIWSTNTDQKLQIMEQIMMMFNPSLELQTTDNFVDWTSLSVVELTDITFTSRQVPQGTESEIDIGTLTLETPIWISAPSKVKRLGVIQDIVMNIHDNEYTFETQETVTIGGFNIFVYSDKASNSYYAELLDPSAIIEALPDIGDTLWKKYGNDLNWRVLLDQYTNFKPGSSQLFLTQPNGNEIIGTVHPNLIDETKLIIYFDADTYNTDTIINGKTGINAIVNPETWTPTNANLTEGDRFLLLGDIGAPAYDPTMYYQFNDIVIYQGQYYKSISDDPILGILPTDNKKWKFRNDETNRNPYSGPSAWKNSDDTDFVAKANNIIEWNGTGWTIVPLPEGLVYTKNQRTGVQYKYEDGEWTRAFEGEYSKGQWRLVI